MLEETSFQNKNRGGQSLDRLVLKEAIAQLPDGYRKVIILHDVHGYEHDEIAQMLGCASGTQIRSSLKRGRNFAAF